MPFGMDKDLGGESKENDTWMEKCVDRLMKQGKEKGSAIAICKTTFKKMKKNREKATFLLDEVFPEKTP